MKRKRLKEKQVLENILDSSDDENNQSTTVTSEKYSPSTSSSADNLNTSSNETNSDVYVSIGTLSSNSYLNSQNLVSKVWSYATKSDDGKQAACQLCDFKCSCNS